MERVSEQENNFYCVVEMNYKILIILPLYIFFSIPLSAYLDTKIWSICSLGSKKHNRFFALVIKCLWEFLIFLMGLIVGLGIAFSN